MSRCCVNAPAHHSHRWAYFRRLRRGLYEILPEVRKRPRPGPQPLVHDPIVALYEKGVDRTLVRANLRLTVEQRLQQLQGRIDSISEFGAAATRLSGLIRTLVDSRIRFVTVAGVAAAIHGSGRLTQDLDLVYERSAPNIRRIADALAKHDPYLRGAPPGLPFVWTAATVRRGHNFTLQTGLGNLDLLGEIAAGGDYTDLLPHSIEVEAFGRRLRCLDLATLIRAKRAAGRPKDLEAIAELYVISKEQGGN